MRAIMLGLFVLASLAPQATAQWKKLTVASHLNDSNLSLDTLGPIPTASWNFASLAGSFNFSTTEGPTDATASSVEFAVQDHEFAVTTMIGGQGARRYDLNPTNSTARAVYNAGTDALEFLVTSTDSEGLRLVFTIHDPAGDFNVNMTNMPEVGYVANGSVFCVLHTPARSFQAVYLRPNSVFAVGAVQYSAGAGAQPPPRPCSIADLVAPFGVVDFFDLVAYLNELNAGCP